ncbi:MAG: hypothetical protein ABIK13_03950 [Patescibacteria group bacterium]
MKITKKDQKHFLDQLRAAAVEKDVENAFRSIFSKNYAATFSSPYGCDGYLEPNRGSLLEDDAGALRLLLEVKWRKNFEDGDRIRLLAQSIYYLKKFQQDGNPLPNVIVGGDENEMFTVYAPKLYHYLDEDYDWSIAPSSAGTENEKLFRLLNEDDNVRDIFIFRIDKNFDINEVIHNVNDLRAIGEFKKLHVDEANLRKVFDEFVRLVFGGDEWLAGVKKIGADEAVSVFIQSILGRDDIFIHPNKPNILVVGQRELRINGSAYNAFFSRYDRKYTTKERDLITSIADQLIEEIKRRFHGDFWTPTIWASRAIEMMTTDLGADWREKYVVWDCAAGTKNLTRDYQFKRLYSSTLHQSEIDLGRNYNKNATTFQYDFLNDDIDVNPNSDWRDLKMPKSLFEALKNDEPIVFYTNPPYGQATEQGEKSKAGVAQTRIGGIMRDKDFGLASAELYTQFIYRVQKLTWDFQLTNIFFFFFNKGFLVSPAFEKFTDQMLKQFRFNGGFMLNAGEFEGTSSAWGIIFSDFQVITKPVSRQTEFVFGIEKMNPNSRTGIEKISEHTLRRVAKGNTITDWLDEIKLPSKEFNNGKYPRILGGFNTPTGNSPRGKLKEGAIGFFHNNGQNVQYSDKYSNLNTAMNYADNGRTVTPDNFERACVTFSVRKSILPDASWVNDKDVFRRPSEKFQSSPEWTEFVHDCVVFSLFHRSSYQTSLRNFEYEGGLYDVPNEWFFMPRKKAIALAERYDLPAILDDARDADERYVYRYLSKIQLSDAARDLLLAGEALVERTFAKRYMADQDHPEWHLLTWDAGYYQAYKIYTQYKTEFKDAYEMFDKARTHLETKIRKQVYKDKILEK